MNCNPSLKSCLRENKGKKEGERQQGREREDNFCPIGSQVDGWEENWRYLWVKGGVHCNTETQSQMIL